MAYDYVNKAAQMTDVTLRYKNFSGARNENGDKGFAIVLPDDMAQQMSADGWNVKTYQPKDEEEPIFLLNVKVRYDKYPPEIYMVTEGSRTLLNDMTIGKLDDVRIIGCDFQIRQSHWNNHGKSGVSAYLIQGDFVIEEADKFISKYNFD